jgi:hypothetical protein
MSGDYAYIYICMRQNEQGAKKQTLNVDLEKKRKRHILCMFIQIMHASKVKAPSEKCIK